MNEITKRTPRKNLTIQPIDIDITKMMRRMGVGDVRYVWAKKINDISNIRARAGYLHRLGEGKWSISMRVIDNVAKITKVE